MSGQMWIDHGEYYRLQEEIERLRKVLEFYAKQETYHNDFSEDYYDIFSDFGRLAREALTHDEENTAL